MAKALKDIKHGQRVVELLDSGKLFFVDDIKRSTGFDDNTLKKVLRQLLKHGYVQKNDRGQWFTELQEEEPDEGICIFCADGKGEIGSTCPLCCGPVVSKKAIEEASLTPLASEGEEWTP